jgi:hypothetical protein
MSQFLEKKLEEAKSILDSINAKKETSDAIIIFIETYHGAIIQEIIKEGEEMKKSEPADYEDTLEYYARQANNQAITDYQDKIKAI